MPIQLKCTIMLEEKAASLGLKSDSRDKKPALTLLVWFIQRYHSRYHQFEIKIPEGIPYRLIDSKVRAKLDKEVKSRQSYEEWLDVIFDACWHNSYRVDFEEQINALNIEIRHIIRFLQHRSSSGGRRFGESVRSQYAKYAQPAHLPMTRRCPRRGIDV